MGEFLTFRKFITPVVIQIIFWIGVALSIIGGIYFMATAPGAGAILMGLLTIVLGPIFVRIYCEVLIIFFRMHDRMASIDDKTR